MKRLIIYLIILVAAVWLGLKIAEDPGYALFAYQRWTVEMPLWLAALGIIFAPNQISKTWNSSTPH